MQEWDKTQGVVGRHYDQFALRSWNVRESLSMYLANTIWNKITNKPYTQHVRSPVPQKVLKWDLAHVISELCHETNENQHERRP